MHSNKVWKGFFALIIISLEKASLPFAAGTFFSGDGADRQEKVLSDLSTMHTCIISFFRYIADETAKKPLKFISRPQGCLVSNLVASLS